MGDDGDSNEFWRDFLLVHLSQCSLLKSTFCSLRLFGACERTEG